MSSFFGGGASTATTTGGAESLSDGDDHVVVSGTFPASYHVLGAPSWVTAWSVTDKSVTDFTITFATPAPTGGTFDWTLL